ncbi:MAG: MFS transporter [Rhodobacterales bacterium]|nr:MFS transporter [Rhodobacterales bacterium]
MPIVDPRYRVLFLALFGVFTIFGMSMTIIGAALPKILASFGWSYFTAGLVLAANAIAYFSFTFVGGYAIRHLGPRRTMLCGLSTAAVGLMFFGSTSDPLTNILLGAMIGIGQGFVEITVNWTTLRLDTAKSGRPMNLMHGAFAIGAIVGPLTLAALLRAGLDWVAVYHLMAAVFLALFVLFLLLPMRLPPDAPEPKEGRTPQRLSTNPAYFLSFLALFFYVGVEIGVSNWLAEYFVAVFDFPVAQSALLVSLFWVGLLAGRFGVPLLYHGARQDRLLVGFSLLATITIAMLSILGFASPGVFTQSIAMVMVLLAGLGSSIFYPVVITLLGNCFPHAQSQAIGFAATGGGIGAFVFPFLMSALADTWGIRVGFATYAVFGVAMTLAAYGLARSAMRR